MTEHQSSRTLVKSAPELWAECSDAASLARHLGAFGEIRITKLEPETTVAWEGAAASGTVTLESSGWGTRVTLTVKEEHAPPAEPEVAPEPEAAVPEPEAVEPDPAPVEPGAIEPEPEPEPEPEAVEPEAVGSEVAPRPARFGWLRRSFRRKPAPVPEPEALGPDPEPAAQAPPELVAVAEPAPPPEPEPAPPLEPEPAPPLEPEPAPPLSGEDALVAALDSLGRAHHRPYSRA
jgi:hypothetical protein